MTAFLKAHWLKILAIAALLGALGSFPFVYYQIMNWIVVGAGIMTVQQARVQKKAVIAWVFLAVAVVFNPVAPLYLRQDVWRVLDIVAAVLFLLSFFLLRAKKD